MTPKLGSFDPTAGLANDIEGTSLSNLLMIPTVRHYWMFSEINWEMGISQGLGSSRYRFVKSAFLPRYAQSLSKCTFCILFFRAYAI